MILVNFISEVGSEVQRHETGTGTHAPSLAQDTSIAAHLTSGEAQRKRWGFRSANSEQPNHQVRNKVLMHILYLKILVL